MAKDIPWINSVLPAWQKSDYTTNGICCTASYGRLVGMNIPYTNMRSSQYISWGFVYVFRATKYHERQTTYVVLCGDCVRETGPRFNIHIIRLAIYGISNKKIRQSRNHLIVIMGIPLLIRHHFIEIASRSIQYDISSQQYGNSNYKGITVSRTPQVDIHMYSHYIVFKLNWQNIFKIMHSGPDAYVLFCVGYHSIVSTISSLSISRVLG